VDTTWLELTPDGLKGKVKKDLTGYLSMNMYGKLMYWNSRNINEDMKDEFSIETEGGGSRLSLEICAALAATASTTA